MIGRTSGDAGRNTVCTCGRHGGIHAGHLHLVIEVARIAQAANENSRSGPLRGRDDEIAERGADDFAAGTAPKRGRDLFEHGEPFLGRKQRRLAGMDADGEHQPVGQPHGAAAPRQGGHW